ncbi:hypothetical protein FQA39_LY04645 [Lamprigera yunnana]|nr:hypothetical protein FQA39_LY04645 [Lamprigera yunnana]
MASVYINARTTEESVVVNLESLILIYVHKICQTQAVLHVKEYRDDTGPFFKVNRGIINFKICYEVPAIANYCKWPVVVIDNVVTAGLSSVCRQLIKNCDTEVSNLLGFREACLMACNEVSIWTKFCEIDMICSTKEFANNPCDYFYNNNFYVPVDLSRFENHMCEPVKIHNVYKLARLKNKNKWLSSNVPVNQLNLDHKFAEGPSMTLSDVLLYPCFKVMFKMFDKDLLQSHLPLTLNWFKNVYLDLMKFDIDFELTNQAHYSALNVIQFPISKTSLYASDTKRYKPQNRIYTKQCNVEKALSMTADLPTINNELPFGHELYFSWNDLPLDASPESGALPASRQNRKCQQLENLAKATLKAAKLKENNIVVDFCSGSGHLGILIAALLPKSHIILVENKEKSLIRAAERIKKMNLSNISLVQSNLDYFVSNFDIGLALHACGVATDLVIQRSIEIKAHFVCCPCCYGGIHDCHHLTYPRSKQFGESHLSYKDYLIIGHSADQTHEEKNLKTAQGYLCMNIIDNDRMLYAKECGYNVYLGKLEPPSCTPKNNLLVGLYCL